MKKFTILIFLCLSYFCQAQLVIDCLNCDQKNCDISINVQKTNSQCNQSNGTANVNVVNGGVAPYQFTWSNNQTSANASNLSPGQYSVQVLDADSCFAYANVTILEFGCITCNTGQSCDDGDPCTVNDELDANCNCVGANLGVSVGESCNDNNVCTDNDVYDSNCRCNGTLNTSCCPNPITANISSNDPTCTTENNGSITVTNITGGNNNYTISWDGPGVFTGNNVSNGVYEITITSGSCTYSQTVTLNSTNPCTTTTVCTEGASCDDGDPCTTNEIYNSSCECIPQTILDCANDVLSRTCDDGKICTTNDLEYYKNCDNQICIPCAGTFQSSTCDDGDPLTFNDTYLDDGSCTCVGTPCNFTPTWTVEQPKCFGETGDIILATGFYSMNTLTNLSAGIYNIEIFESGSDCSVFQNIAINSVTQIFAGCGNSVLNVSGGSGIYDYIWSTGSTTSDIPTIPGTHSVTITDANNCSITHQCTVDLICNVSATLSSNQVSCNGAADGTVSLNPTGGYPPYNYQWSNGASSQNLVSVAGGNYQVTITDSQNCMYVDNIDVDEPLPLSTFCRKYFFDFDNDGNFEEYVGANPPIGGTGPFTYQWSGLGSGTDRWTLNIGDGDYTVLVTDANGCTYSETCPTPCANITANVQLDEGNCATNGGYQWISVTSPSGGTGPYQYYWSDIGFGPAYRDSLLCGNYRVRIIDDNGCASGLYNRDNDACNCSMPCENFACSINDNGDGTLSAFVQPGSSASAPYTYQWNTGDTGSSINELSVSYTYTVTITSLENCESVCSFNSSGFCGGPCNSDPCKENMTRLKVGNSCICQGGNDIDSDGDGEKDCDDCDPNDPNLPAIVGSTCDDNNPNTFNDVYDSTGCNCLGSSCIAPTISLVSSDGVCHPGNGGPSNNGSITVNSSGGQSPYNYSWSNGGSTNSITNLSYGTYTVTVVDDNGCSASKSFNVDYLPLIVLNHTKSNATCPNNSNGSINLSVTGGSGGYTYNWSNGSNVQDIFNLIPANYSVTVTDSKSCLSAVSVVIIGEDCSSTCTTANLPINSTIQACNNINGTATANPNAGAAPYTYQWDSNAANQTTQTAVMLAGNQSYCVTVTDSDNCTYSNCVFVNADVCNTCDIEINLNILNPACNGNSGVAISNPTGGSGNYTYNWSVPGSSNVQTLPVGSYTLNVSDDNGCSVIENFTISEPDKLVAVITKDNADCFNSTGGVFSSQNGGSVSGGTGTYTYDWSDGSTTPDASNLPLSTSIYQLTVTDENGCTAFSNNVVYFVPQEITLNNSNVVDETCLDKCDGSIELDISGGTGFLTYNWSSGGGTNLIENLCPGIYDVTVTDENGCQAFFAETIEASNDNCCPVITMENTNLDSESCIGAGDGYIVNLTPRSDGLINFPYYYTWNDGQASNQNDRAYLSAGTYILTVTEGESGCTEEFTYVIDPGDVPCGDPCQTDNVDVSHTSVDASNGDDSGSINLSVTGNTAPYTYQWVGPNSFASTDEDLVDLGYGKYNVTVTSADGCLGYAEIILCGFPYPGIYANNIGCAGDSNGFIEDFEWIQSSLIQPISFNWSTGSTSFPLTNLSAGNYDLTITDGAGCSVEMPFVITEPDPLNITCDENGLIVTGGTPPYNYNWNGNSDDESFPCSNNPKVTITDVRGCVDTYDASNCCPTYPVQINRCCDGQSIENAQVFVNGQLQGVTDANGFYALQYCLCPEDIVSISSYQDLYNGLDDGDMCELRSTLLNKNGGVQTQDYCWQLAADVDGSGGLSTQDLFRSFGQTSQPDTDWYFYNSAFVSQTGVCPLPQPSNQATIAEGFVFTAIKVGDVNCNSVTVLCDSPSALNISASSTSDDGSGNGAISVTGSGGDGNYFYTIHASDLQNNNHSGCDNDGNYINVPCDTYTVEVKDGCGTFTTTTVTVDCDIPPDCNCDIMTSVVPVASSCKFSSDGSASIDPLTITGCNGGPYTITWDDGSTGNSITGLTGGSKYNVYIKDKDGCPSSIEYIVPNGPALNGSFSSTNQTCNALGTLTINPSSGVAPYTYNWLQSGGVGNTMTNVAGPYTVEITDADGCQGTFTGEIDIDCPDLDDLYSCTNTLTGVQLCPLDDCSGDLTITINNEEKIFDTCEEFGLGDNDICIAIVFDNSGSAGPYSSNQIQALKELILSAQDGSLFDLQCPNVKFSLHPSGMGSKEGKNHCDVFSSEECKPIIDDFGQTITSCNCATPMTDDYSKLLTYLDRIEPVSYNYDANGIEISYDNEPWYRDCDNKCPGNFKCSGDRNTESTAVLGAFSELENCENPKFIYISDALPHDGGLCNTSSWYPSGAANLVNRSITTFKIQNLLLTNPEVTACGVVLGSEYGTRAFNLTNSIRQSWMNETINDDSNDGDNVLLIPDPENLYNLDPLVQFIKQPTNVELKWSNAGCDEQQQSYLFDYCNPDCNQTN